jgi:hypothetical protein
MKFKTYEMKFEGELLSRGFWLYVWEIKYKNKLQYYIGRTGDSSSVNASSPFVRSARHLNFKSNAKGNSLIRQLKTGLSKQEILKCQFRLIAIGPLFKESSRLFLHRRRRDVMAALEYKVAKHFKEQTNREVIGNHASRKTCNDILFRMVIHTIKKKLIKSNG